MTFSNEQNTEYKGMKPTKTENPNFRCRQCKSDDVFYRIVESFCGGYEDVNYHCRSCGRDWWVESSDA